MITSYVELDESATIVAALPSLLTCNFQDLSSRDIFATVASMGVVPAYGTGARATLSANR